jgi:hypothetical protein
MLQSAQLQAQLDVAIAEVARLQAALAAAKEQEAAAQNTTKPTKPNIIPDTESQTNPTVPKQEPSGNQDTAGKQGNAEPLLPAGWKERIILVHHELDEDGGTKHIAYSIAKTDCCVALCVRWDDRLRRVKDV